MKKLFAILLTLCMILALPVAAMAEDADNTTGTALVGGADSSEVETAVTEEPSDEPSKEPSKEAETYHCTCENCVTEEETTAPATQTISFGFFPGTLSETLPIMGMGMLGIFLVTCVIILAVLILSKLGKKDEE